MSLKHHYLFLMISVSALCVGGYTEKRNGIIFVQDTDVSIGSATWKVLSVLDSNWLVESFQRAEELKQKLFRYFKENKEYSQPYEKTLNRQGPTPYKKIDKGAVADAENYNSEQQFEHMTEMSGLARDKIQELDVYMGNENRLKKRQFASAGASVGTLFYKIAADLFGYQTKAQYEERMEQFVETFQPQYDDLKKTVQEVINFNDFQVTYNRGILIQIVDQEDKYQFLEKELSKLGVNAESRIKIQFLIQFLLQTYKDLVELQDKILQGLVDATKGIPSTPFLTPSKVLNSVLSYQETGTLEKSVFGQEDVLELYDLATTKVTKIGDKIGVTSTINIPTTSTKGRLFRLVTYPLYQSDKDAYVTVKPTHRYIAINAKSQYVLLNDEDLNGCDHSNTMILCEAGTKIWKNRDEPSCEASLWFEDDHVTEALCDYEIEDARNPKLTYINQGVFAYAMPRRWSVPFECTGEFQTSENRQLENNGFITLSPRCVASVQSHLLRNLLTDEVRTFETKDDESYHNVDKIRNVKEDAAKAKAEIVTDEITLNNEDIIESILDEEAILAKEHEIIDLFEESEQRLQIGLTEEEKEEREESLQEEERVDMEEQSKINTLIYLVVFVTIMVFTIIFLMSYAYFCIINKT